MIILLALWGLFGFALLAARLAHHAGF